MKISVLIVSLFFLVTHVSDCSSQTVGGRPGESPVESTVFPESPTTDDLITFDLNAGGIKYGNACGQLAALGGSGFSITVDETSRLILIGVTGNHPGFCTADYDPVNGLTGSMGPLAAGDWEIRSSFPLDFPPFSTFGETLSFTVTSAHEPITGDFGADGDVDGDDVDFYIGNLGQPATGDLAQLDLNGDGDVTIADHDLLVTTFVVTSNGVTGALLGDVDLDGNVDVSADGFALVGSLGQIVTSRSQGDLDADGSVTVLNDAFRLVHQLGQSN